MTRHVATSSGRIGKSKQSMLLGPFDMSGLPNKGDARAMSSEY